MADDDGYSQMCAGFCGCCFFLPPLLTLSLALANDYGGSTERDAKNAADFYLMAWVWAIVNVSIAAVIFGTREYFDYQYEQRVKKLRAKRDAGDDLTDAELFTLKVYERGNESNRQSNDLPSTAMLRMEDP